MARLNEAAPPAESIDALKRRFIRQNREISRVNSTQSLRIRNLEAEISRLLAENIAIREEAIRSEQEVERLRLSQRVFKDVSRLKDQLESKLAEAGNLVAEVGRLPEKAKRRTSQHQQQRRRRSGPLDTRTSPDDRDQPKGRPIIGGLIAAGDRHQQEGRLPAISEGEQYPRKTLNCLEIGQMMDHNDRPDESPELGPPPVAHFDVAEPLHLTPHVQGSAIPAGEESEGYQGHEDVKPLPENLEKRRKRRASALIQDMSTVAGTGPLMGTASERGTVPKSARKRKLEACTDPSPKVSAQSDTIASALSQKPKDLESPQTRPKGSRFMKLANATSGSGGVIPMDLSTKPELAPRKALAPKSTNSPSKSKKKPASDKAASAKEDSGTKSKIEKGMRPEETESAETQSPSKLQSLRVEEMFVPSELEHDDMPPKTPPGTDLLSPISSEPSARTEQPTEAALTASVEEVLGGTDGRASRRARGAISYAEPSLRAKMRRPTKEFIPAVIEQANGPRLQQYDSIGKDTTIDSPSFLKKRTENPKSEKTADDFTIWKGLTETLEEPTSPLLNNAANSSRKPSTSVSISQEIEAQLADEQTDGLEHTIKNLSVYDGPKSSPQDSPDAMPVVRPRKSARRHSSNQTGLPKVGQEFGTSPFGSDQVASRNHQAAEAAGGRGSQRHSLAASSRKDNPTQKDKADLKRSASISRLKPSAVMRANTAVDTGMKNGGAGAAGRRERMAARRSSMML